MAAGCPLATSICPSRATASKTVAIFIIVNRRRGFPKPIYKLQAEQGCRALVLPGIVLLEICARYRSSQRLKFEGRQAGIATACRCRNGRSTGFSHRTLQAKSRDDALLIKNIHLRPQGHVLWMQASQRWAVHVLTWHLWQASASPQDCTPSMLGWEKTGSSCPHEI